MILILKSEVLMTEEKENNKETTQEQFLSTIYVNCSGRRHVRFETFGKTSADVSH